MSYDENYNPSRAKRGIVKSSPFHHVGECVFQAADGSNQAVRFSSLGEYQAILCCLYIENCVDIEEQLAPVWYTKSNGKLAPHWLDFRATKACGRRIGLICKPERIAAHWAFREEMRRVGMAALLETVDEVCIVTERNINRVDLHNAKLFHACRHLEPQIDRCVEEGLQQIVAPITVRSFLKDIGLGGAGYRSVVRAIRRGAICVAHGMIISADSLVWKESA